MNVQDISLALIVEGERRREDYGDIAALAAGISRVGLLEPIIVDRMADGRYRLVAGGRRLRAMQSLGAEGIAAVLRDTLTEDELRDIELEENQNRQQLSSFELSKVIVDKAEKAVERILPTVGKKRGRPPKGKTSRQTKADAIGEKLETYRLAEEHVDIALRFPFLQSLNWRQAEVLRFREHLKRLSDDEQTAFCDFLVQTSLPMEPIPITALECAEAMTMKTPEGRAEIYRLAASDDPRERTLAKTRAQHLPPMPDGRTMIIDAALTELRKTIRAPLDTEPEAEELRSVIAILARIRKTIKRRFDELKESEAVYVQEDEVRRETAVSA